MPMIEDPQMLLMLIYLVPLAALGTIFAYWNWIEPRLMNKRGMLQIRQQQANDRINKKWVKVEIESVYDKEKNQTNYQYFWKNKGNRIALYDFPGAVYWDGSTKYVLYDTEWNQVALGHMAKIQPQVNPKMLDSLLERTWNIARATVFGQNKMMLILIIVAAGLAGISMILGIANMQALEAARNDATATRLVIDSINATLANLGGNGRIILPAVVP